MTIRPEPTSPRNPEQPAAPGPAPRWDYDPPADGPAVLHQELFESTQKNGSSVPGGYVVVDKPAGLLAVPGIGDHKADCARSRVLSRFPFATGPMSVHRLDLPTSGVLVLALDAATHRNLSLQFERRRVSKRYLALVEGHLDSDQGAVDVPIRKDLDRAPAQLVDFDQGKASRTLWRVLSRESIGGLPVTRLELTPETGRTHQLRVHCADPLVRTVGAAPPEFEAGGRGLRAPIVGDDLYSGRPWPRLLLHAWSLTFNHPLNGKMMSVNAPAPF